MKCSEAERWISFLVDGEALPEENARAVHEHVAACSSCRDLLRLEKERASLLSSALGGEGTDESRLAAAIASGPLSSGRGAAAAEMPGRFLARRLQPAAWLAAALLAFSVTGAGLWWGSDALRRAAGRVEIARESLSPAGDSPYQLRYVEDSWELMPVGGQSIPVGREIHRSRSRILDLPVKNPDSPGPQSPRSWTLDVERVDTRYYQLTSWPYD